MKKKQLQVGQKNKDKKKMKKRQLKISQKNEDRDNHALRELTDIIHSGSGVLSSGDGFELIRGMLQERRALYAAERSRPTWIQ